jgi:uncharacterized protein (TIGR02118 family)
MAAHLLVLYHPPKDTAAFDAYYQSTHVPIAKKLPGLRRYSLSREVAAAGGGASPYHLVADLEFDSSDAIGRATASPEGAAAIEDTGKFATGGLTILTYESFDV